MRNSPITGLRGTVELNDNRMSLFVGQKGLCGIMGNELEIQDMNCHHKNPYHICKDDSYSNLMLISSISHRLVHATKIETINKYMNLLRPNKSQIEKINRLRELVGNKNIITNEL